MPENAPRISENAEKTPLQVYPPVHLNEENQPKTEISAETTKVEDVPDPHKHLEISMTLGL